MSNDSSIHFKCSCEPDNHIGHSAFDKEEILNIERTRRDFTFSTSDKEIEEDRYSEGRYVQRPMKKGNRALKEAKQWRASVQERSVLRYTTGGTR